MVHEVQDCHHVGEANPDCEVFENEKDVTGNSPSQEDHGLGVGVFLEHDAEERRAGGEDELVSSHHVAVTHLQRKRR